MADEIKVFFKCRADIGSKPQADTVVVERYRELLQASGIQVVTAEADATFLHFFGVHSGYGISAPVKPYAISPLIDIDANTLRYAEAVGRSLTEYVSAGQQNLNWTPPVQSATTDHTSLFFDGSKDFFLKASTIFVQSNSEKVILEKQFGPLANISLAPIGLPEAAPTVATEDFGARYNVKDFILCIARIEPRKNQLMLLKAFEKSPIPIVLIDGGLNVNPEYEAAVKSFKRSGPTIITGKISQALITSAIKSARVHVLPSFFEIPGIVSLEAIRQGCPVIATRTGTTTDYLKDAALFCSPSDTDSIYNATLAAYYAPRPAADASPLTWKSVVAMVAQTYKSLSTPPRKGVSNIAAETLDAIDLAIEKAEAFAIGNDLVMALSTVKELEESHPNDFRAQRALAAMLLSKGKVKEAKSRFLLAHTLNSEDGKSIRGARYVLGSGKQPPGS